MKYVGSFVECVVECVYVGVVVLCEVCGIVVVVVDFVGELIDDLFGVDVYVVGDVDDELGVVVCGGVENGDFFFFD